MSKSIAQTKAAQARARNALEKFNRMIPVLSGFASALSGRRVVVKPGEITHTDGKSIVVRVPYELGDQVMHEVSLCDERDPESSTMLCPACRQHDQVMGRIFHEIGHLSFESFGSVNPEDVRDFSGPEAEAIRRHLKTTRGRDAFAVVAKALGEKMMPVVQAVEDVRVDAAMRRLRPGLGVVQEALILEALGDPELAWDEAPLDAQASIAPVVASQAPHLLERFHPYLVDVLEKVDIYSIVEQMEAAPTVGAGVYYASKYVNAMKPYGFFGGPEEEEEEDESEGDAGDGADGSEGSEGSPGGGGGGGSESSSGQPSGAVGGGDPGAGGPGEGELEGAGEDAGAALPERSDEDGGPDSDEPEERDVRGQHDEEPVHPGGPKEVPGDGAEVDPLLPDEGDDSVSEEDSPGALLSVADGGEEAATPLQAQRPDGDEFGEVDVAQELVEALTGHNEFGHPEIDEDFSDALVAVIETMAYFETPSRELTGVEVDTKRSARRRVTDIPESILGPATLRMRRVFEENRRAKYDRNRRSGRVSSRVLGRRAWSDDSRLFQRKTLPGKRDYAVLIGVDVSGSTSRGDVLRLEVQAALAQAELCHRVGLKFAVYAHSGTTSNELYIKEVKTFEGPWNDVAKRDLSSLLSLRQNYDGHTLEFYRKQLDRVQATDKILMYYSDGAMPAENYDEELALLKSEIAVCRKKDYVLLAVGARTNAPAEHGMDTVRLDVITDLPRVVDHLGKRIAEL